VREIGEDGRNPEESFLYHTISVPISLRLIKESYVGIRDDLIAKEVSTGGETLAEADLVDIGEQWEDSSQNADTPHRSLESQRHTQWSRSRRLSIRVSVVKDVFGRVGQVIHASVDATFNIK
jgi:hypothetical protein